MAGDERFTAYCGLFCGDCIPARKSLFEVTGKLEDLLKELQFENYAELKVKTDGVFDDYPEFASVLSAIMKLQCPAPCREGGGKQDCAIRECARGKSYEGCWECDERSGCRLLAPLKEFHGETIEKNLEAIRENGPGGWSGKRGKHYPWS